VLRDSFLPGREQADAEVSGAPQQLVERRLLLDEADSSRSSENETSVSVNPRRSPSRSTVMTATPAGTAA
jgi:hypothetical protein